MGLCLAQQDSISAARLYIVGGATLGGFVYGHVLQNNMWWKGEKSPFHAEWKNDWKYALGADKIGHMFFPYMVTRTYSGLFRWAGLSAEKSIWYGSGVALTYQSYIEIRDGFSKKYGFSWGDWAADVAGAGIPVMQYYYPSIRDIRLKISFYSSEKFRKGSNAYIIDDYESTYHWISYPLQKVIPGFPGKLSFVNAALGHCIRYPDAANGGSHELFLSLDWDLEKIKTGWEIADALIAFLNHYHLPSPAIKVYPDIKFYGLKF